MTMIDRYILPEMGALWTELFKKQMWHEVELASLQTQEILGHIPQGTHKEAKQVVVDEELLKRADELEKISDHDLNAFVKAVSERLKNPLYHRGMTSYDTEDTALALIIQKSIGLIEIKLERLRKVLLEQSKRHKHTAEIGRTHFIHAEPITFGFKILGWVDIIERHQSRLAVAREESRVGKLSGAVGIYSLPPEVEKSACALLCLKAAKISTQVISRDILLHLSMILVGIANSLERFSTEVRLLAGTDLSEVAEFKKPGAEGSSAMPGKSKLRNPIKSENITGLAAVAFGYLSPSSRCEILWNERTLPNSAAERIYLPDLFAIVDFMLQRFADTMEKLEVFPAQMERNIWRTGGIVFAQAVMLKLIEKGMSRLQAYKLVEAIALTVEHGTYQTPDGKTFKILVFENQEIRERISEEELNECFDYKFSTRYIDEIFARFEK